MGLILLLILVLDCLIGFNALVNLKKQIRQSSQHGNDSMEQIFLKFIYWRINNFTT
jgi:hypothetical protein